MQNDQSGAGATPGGAAAVSPNNPCPFLRAVVAEGYVDGHVVPLSQMCHTVEAASGKTGLQKKLVGIKTCLVALIANGLSPLRLWRSWWSGPTLDALRDGPLDKHGVGSRILDATAHVDAAELARLAEFGKDCADPRGGTERGLTASEIVTYMNANFERAAGHRRRIDRKLMNGEWPVLLDIMGKGEGAERYLSVAEVRTLFEQRRLPERINVRLASLRKPSRASIVLGKVAKAVSVVVIPLLLLLVAIAEFPNQVGKIIPPLANFLPPSLPKQPPVKAAHWLDQNWSIEDRHWFHHASQGTATFPVPYSWFVALEQSGLHLFTRPGLLADPNYLERFGFIPSPKSATVDAETLKRFGFVNTPGVKTEPAPASVAGLKPTPVDNFDGLPVGFSRMSNVRNPGTGAPGVRQDRADLRGLPHRQHPLPGCQHPLRRRRRHAGPAQARKSFRSCHFLHPDRAGPLRAFRHPRARSRRRQGEKGRAQEGPQGGCRLPEKPDRDHPEDAESQGPEGHRRRIWPARRAEPDRQPGLLCRFRGERSFRLRQQSACQRCTGQFPAGVDRAMAVVGAV